VTPSSGAGTGAPAQLGPTLKMKTAAPDRPRQQAREILSLTEVITEALLRKIKTSTASADCDRNRETSINIF
jgi:hypothetical protein